ncbi:MAG: hypothetical protein QOJ86_1168 [Bradyrhizobium sp.]|nr:hypothetical protein [Bradyrhizobium sp.]
MKLLHLSPLAGRGRIASSDAIPVRGTLRECECVERPLTRSLRWRSGFDLSPPGRGENEPLQPNFIMLK